MVLFADHKGNQRFIHARKAKSIYKENAASLTSGERQASIKHIFLRDTLSQIRSVGGRIGKSGISLTFKCLYQLMTWGGFLRRIHLSRQPFPKAGKKINRALRSVLLRFMMQKKGRTTTRLVKLPRAMLGTPTKALPLCVCLAAEMFKNMSLRYRRVALKGENRNVLK